MGTVNCDKVECDELTDKAGSGLPNNLRNLTPFCYGVIQNNVLGESVNVSSVSVTTDGVTVNMTTDASSTNYAIMATRNGVNSGTKTYSISYYAAAYSGGVKKTKSTFTLIAVVNGAVATANEISFLVFDKG